MIVSQKSGVTDLIIFDLPMHLEEFSIYDCRDVFPLGLPEQFSFITTFRTRKLPKSPWHIIRMSDIQNKPQFVITMNPRKETIEFSILDFLGRLQTLVFYNVPVRCNYFNICKVTEGYAIDINNVTISIMYPFKCSLTKFQKPSYVV